MCTCVMDWLRCQQLRNYMNVHILGTKIKLYSGALYKGAFHNFIISYQKN